MILQGLREKSNKKYLNKLLAERTVNVNNNRVISLGVILNIDEIDDFDRSLDRSFPFEPLATD